MFHWRIRIHTLVKSDTEPAAGGFLEGGLRLCGGDRHHVHVDVETSR